MIMKALTENTTKENGTVEELKNAFTKNDITAEQFEVITEELRAENRELQARGEEYKRRIRELEKSNEESYLRGRIDGLEFSIRCNGVCGDSVKHA